jgi:hypothetical protein
VRDDRCGEQHGGEPNHSRNCPCPNCPGTGACVCTLCAKCLSPPAVVSTLSSSLDRYSPDIWNYIPDSPCFRLLRPPRAV